MNSQNLEQFLCFIQIIALSSFKFSVFGRSCSHFLIATLSIKSFYKILKYYFLARSCDDRKNAGSILKFTHSLYLHNNINSGNCCTTEEKAIIFLIRWSNFEIKLQIVSYVVLQLLLVSFSYWKLTKYVMCCPIRYHLYNLKNVKNIHGGVSILVNLQASDYNFTKTNTPPWVFFTFLKLYKW